MNMLSSRFLNRTGRCFLGFFVFVSLMAYPGCGKSGGGGKSDSVKKHGEPTWMKVDPAKFVPLVGEDVNKDVDRDDEGNPRLRVFDPQGWTLMSNTGKKDARGNLFIAGFQKGNTRLELKGSDSKVGSLDEEDLYDFAVAVQGRYKTPVKMVKLGSLYGATFDQRIANSKRPGHFIDKTIIATVRNDRFYVFEAIAESGKRTPQVRNALYTFAATTKLLDAEGNEIKEADAITVAAAKPEPAPAETKPETTTAATETKPESAPAEKPAETKPETTVAETKPAEKPAEKPAAKKPPKKKKADTKDILDELDNLLN